MIDLSTPFAILAVALLIDATFGDPISIWERLPHPVVLIGRLISAAEKRLNKPEIEPGILRVRGLGLASGLALGGLIAGWGIQTLLLALPFGWLIVAVLASTLLAQKSLYDHVLAVAEGLETLGIEGGRSAVARIVGRDPETLDEAGVTRAAIESTAENFADGVVAPAFWFAVLGLGGLVAYKAINTMDSMIGHRSPRYEDFGKAAARLDDLVNLVPARLSALFVALAAGAAGGNIRHSIGTVWRDAGKHRSPNAGWPEAAMAGALDIALAGPRTYGGTVTDDPFINPDGRKDGNSQDIRRALRVFIGACAAQALVVGALWAAT